MSEELKSKKYSADSIQALEGIEHVRMRPSMYIGDVGVRGLHHLVYEVVDNSIDEAMGGHCDTISVTINEDNSITVEDNGRGIPVDLHKKEGVSALEVVMTKIGAGGKFDKDSYKVSGGLHGVGVSVVNALSNHLKATVHRDGKIWEQEYERGKSLYPVKSVGTSDKNGTVVTFHPDELIFTQTIEFSYDTLANRMRELAYLNKGVKISITDRRRKEKDGEFVSEEFSSEEGLKEFIRFLDGNREPLIKEVIAMEGEKNDIPVEVAMVYNNSYTENLHSYVNNINTHEGGTHLSGFRRGLTTTLKKYADNSGMLDKVKFEVAGDDFREGLTAIVSVKVAEPRKPGSICSCKPGSVRDAYQLPGREPGRRKTNRSEGNPGCTGQACGSQGPRNGSKEKPYGRGRPARETGGLLRSGPRAM
jgi:DNA gyrase subunit B